MSLKDVDKFVKKSMIISMLCKPAGIAISFLYTPVLLNCLGNEAYGIWATILSIVNWVNYFDVGVGNGLRNILTVRIENKEKINAQKDVSTAYIVLFFISLFMFTVGSIVIFFIDDHLIFNTNLDVKPVLEISLFFMCLNFVLSLSKILFFSDNHAEKVGIIILLIQAINLFGILLLAILQKGNMLSVAILVGLSGTIVYLGSSIKIWGKYNYLIPKPQLFERRELKNICNIGIKFFLIQIAGMILYTTDSIIITRLFGPSSVTPYQTAYAAFGAVNAIYSAFISPLWSQYTIANEKKDYLKIRKTIIKLEKTLPIVAGVLLLAVFLYEPFSVIWLQKKLKYDFGLIPLIALYNFVYIFGSIFVTVCNGIGRIELQLYLAIAGAILNIPLSYYFGVVLNMKTSGIILATIVCLLFGVVPVMIDIHFYLKRMIWNDKKF